MEETPDAEFLTPCSEDCVISLPAIIEKQRKLRLKQDLARIDILFEEKDYVSLIEILRQPGEDGLLYLFECANNEVVYEEKGGLSYAK